MVPLAAIPHTTERAQELAQTGGIIRWTLDLLCGQLAFQAPTEARQSEAICHSLVGSPPCCISPEYTVMVPSLHPVFSRCTPPTPEHQEQQDFKCLNFANPDSPQRNGLPFSWSRLVQAAAVPFVCSDGPAKLRYFLIHRDVFMLCGPRHPVRWKHTLRLRLLCLSLGHEHSVIPKALFFTQRTESGGTWEPSSLPLASLSTGQRVQVPKVFILTQTGMKLAAVWGGGDLHPQRHWHRPKPMQGSPADTEVQVTKGQRLQLLYARKTLGSGQKTEVCQRLVSLVLLETCPGVKWDGIHTATSSHKDEEWRGGLELREAGLRGTAQEEAA